MFHEYCVVGVKYGFSSCIYVCICVYVYMCAMRSEGYLEDPIVASVVSTTVAAAFTSQEEWERFTHGECLVHPFFLSKHDVEMFIRMHAC
jgi:hypothetical protein